MFDKKDKHKEQYGCKTCKYLSRSLVFKRCMDCKRRKGSKWVAVPKVPQKAYCECCGAEKQ
ncbi:unnamed protein product [marine sediment metagenome]|uniref:Uncharacterized protein n=1 Tax=marine sediment metagenome TaxID=412755 RepID=X1U3U9_9ZZZZ